MLSNVQALLQKQPVIQFGYYALHAKGKDCSMALGTTFLSVSSHTPLTCTTLHSITCQTKMTHLHLLLKLKIFLRQEQMMNPGRDVKVQQKLGYQNLLMVIL